MEASFFARNDDKMLPEDFKFFRELIYSLSGISMTGAKMDLMQSRLRTRLIKLNLPTFSSYRQFLEELPDDHEEWQLFVNQLTTNKTEWFREAGHFEILKKEFLPAWKKAGKGTLNVWCAASSTGEEPYSLALLMHECLGSDFKIIASDIDTKVLQLASNGVYPIEILDQIPERYHSHFARGTKEISGWVKVKNEIKKHIEYQQINLNDEFSFEKKFDLIFCRNVLIYFNPETISSLVNRLSQVTTKEAPLFIGHSESLQNIQSEWKLIGPSIYSKRPA